MRINFSVVLSIGLILTGANAAVAQTRPTKAPNRGLFIQVATPQYGYGYGYSYGSPSATVAAYYKPTYSVTPSYYTSNQSLAIVAPVDPTSYGWSFRLWNREWVLRSIFPPLFGLPQHRLYMSEPDTTRAYNTPPDGM